MKRMPTHLSSLCAGRTLSALLLFVFCHSIAAQGLYKWIDEDGNVHYQDKPPAMLDNQSEITQITTNESRSTIARIPVSIDSSEAAGITRYVLYANELFSSHSSIPSRIIISGDKLWLPFEGSVISFEPSSGIAEKFKLDRIRPELSARPMHIIGDSFVFLANDKVSTTSAFHIYDHANDSHDELPIVTTPTNIISYDDRHGDGIFGFSYHNTSLIQYPNVLNDAGAISARETERPLPREISGISGLAASGNAVWYISGYKRACIVGFYDKRTDIARHFTSDEIGGSSQNGCFSIAADSREVWIASPGDGSPNTTFSVYDIRKGAWDTVEKGKNNPGSYAVSLQMDEERLYYVSCEKIFSVDRKSRRTTAFTLDGPERVDKHRYCITAFKVHDGMVWALKFETYNHRRYPVLYKIPKEKMEL